MLKTKSVLDCNADIAYGYIFLQKKATMAYNQCKSYTRYNS